MPRYLVEKVTLRRQRFIIVAPNYDDAKEYTLPTFPANVIAKSNENIDTIVTVLRNLSDDTIEIQ